MTLLPPLPHATCCVPNPVRGTALVWGCCGAPAEPTVTRATPAGRPPATGGAYCTEHGGTARSRAEAELDWNLRAPASVGDAAAVLEAGGRVLASEHVYVVVRRQPPAHHPDHHRVSISRDAHASLVARLGVRAARALLPDGGWRRESADLVEIDGAARRLLELGVPPEAIQRDTRSGGVQGGPAWIAGVGIGSHYREVGRADTREEALALALSAWRIGLAAEVGAIRAARGGTLAWGMPVEPRTEPLLVEPADGVCTWDALAR